MLTNQLTVNAGGPLEINGGDVITVSGGGTTGVWWVQSGSILTLERMTIIHGYAVNGAGLYNNGSNVTIDNSTLSENNVDGGTG